MTNLYTEDAVIRAYERQRALFAQREEISPGYGRQRRRALLKRIAAGQTPRKQQPYLTLEMQAEVDAERHGDVERTLRKSCQPEWFAPLGLFTDPPEFMKREQRKGKTHGSL